MDGSHDPSRRVFEQGFTVRDVAQPLPSFDEGMATDAAREAMRGRRWEVAGVRAGGLVTGFVELAGLKAGRCGDFAQPIAAALRVSDDLPLAALVLRLNEHPRLFVDYLGQVAAFVGRGDLQREPGRMWLFGMVTLLEMRFGRLIVEHCPGDAWRQFMSPARVEKAEAMLVHRRRGNPRIALADCLQFADKVQIIARHEPLRLRTRFESRRQVEEIGKRLESLRNNLAHGQDIVTEGWETIVALAANLDSVVGGPLPQPPTDATH